MNQEGSAVAILCAFAVKDICVNLWLKKVVLAGDREDFVDLFCQVIADFDLQRLEV